MESSFRSGDLDRLADLGHWLKGAAGTVGFDAFTDPAARLESLARDGRTAEIEPVLAELANLVRRAVVEAPTGDRARRGLK